MAEINTTVKILDEINPDNAGTGEAYLAYDGLATAVDHYRATNQLRGQKVWDAEPGSTAEESKARQLAFEYMVRTAEKSVHARPESRDLWADRYTQASIELYGQPEVTTAAEILREEYDTLVALRGHGTVSQKHLNLVLDAYRPSAELASRNPGAAHAERLREQNAVWQYGRVLKDRYQPLFDMVDTADKDHFGPADLQAVLTDNVTLLAEREDPAWSRWTVPLKEGTSLSVNSKEERIKVADKREPADVAAVKGLVAHEVLVHALRAKNGKKTGISKLGTGLAGSVDTEEGLGILSEYAINGVMPDKAVDRYVDISLALGVVDGRQYTRHELFEVAYARSLVRAQARGETAIDTASLARTTWVHVDRIYRGGTGGPEAGRQAVFTKDIAYYAGYKQMAGFIADKLEEGYSIEQIFDCLSSAKFNPLDERHREEIAAAGIPTIW
ncbi:MAG TPA: tyrosine/phenylalanine carboxypeptidase domain-containing protein [Candidatus Saccharimonadales bacterium]|nr:tyrosine/phenylalanine carboxypeptidase domain-containing protein [Candidatus Saccharimonadales bacterium]